MVKEIQSSHTQYKPVINANDSVLSSGCFLIRRVMTQHKSKWIGPSQREAEVAMRLFVCMFNPLVQNNITLYCPL